MIKPSQHRKNSEARIAEVKAEAAALSSPLLQAAREAGAYQALVEIYAGLADQENAERIAEARDGNTIRRALDILETANADDITDGQFACFFDFLASKMAERTKPVAWAQKGLDMPRTVAELETLLNDACENDGLVIGDAACAAEYADELRLFDRAAARAINAGAA